MGNLSAPRGAPSGVSRLPETAATRYAKAGIRARNFFIAGTLIVPVTLGAFWLKSGRLGILAVGIAIGTGMVVELFGAAQLVQRARAMARYKARLASKGQGGLVASTPLEINFCRRSLGRLGEGAPVLLTGLRERGHTPVVKECLNCCQDCNRGMLVTMIEGTPMSATDGDKLLDDLDELAATES